MGTVLRKMELLSILVFLSTAAAGVHVHAELKQSEVQVSWLTTLSMEIKIGRHHTDIILLTPASNIPGMDTPCLFSGQLEGDPGSVVAVSGCLGGGKTSLSISSRLLPGIVDLSLVDSVSFHVTPEESVDAENDVVLAPGRRKREVDYDYDEDDAPLPPPILNTRNRIASRDFFGPLPKKVVLKTDIKYDNSLLDHFDGSHTKTKEWISRVIELVKPRMSHDSLAMPITLKIGKIEHTNRRLKASKQDINSIIINDSPSSLTSYFCEDLLGESTMRAMSASLESACRTDGYAANINELFATSNSELRTARNFAHVLGHNVGMKHDFDPDHGGKTGPCNKAGLMSYGTTVPDKWSDCSNKDFTEWWRRVGYNCLKQAQPQLDDCKDSVKDAPCISKVNCDCQCANLLYRDENGKTHGNCRRKV